MLGRMKRIALLTVIVLTACGDSSPGPADSGGTGNDGGPSGWRAAVGAGGLIDQTFDDRVWNAHIAFDVDLYAVTCVGNMKGWAAGANGTIAHTEDGGQSWSKQASHTTANLRGVRFADAMRGVLVGDAGALARTEDGGATWSTAASVTTANLTGVAATSTGTFFVSSAGGVVLSSVDGGKTFAPTAIPGAMDLSTIGSNATGDLVIAGDSAGHLFTSTDGAHSFRLEATAMGAVGAVSVAGEWGGESAWGSGTAIAVGDHGVVMRRAPDGMWAIVPTSTTANLHAALITSTLTYVAGDDGTLLSMNGTTFSSVATGTHAALYALDDL